MIVQLLLSLLCLQLGQRHECSRSGLAIGNTGNNPERPVHSMCVCVSDWAKPILSFLRGNTPNFDWSSFFLCCGRRCRPSRMDRTGAR